MVQIGSINHVLRHVGRTSELIKNSDTKKGDLQAALPVLFRYLKRVIAPTTYQRNMWYIFALIYNNPSWF